MSNGVGLNIPTDPTLIPYLGRVSKVASVADAEIRKMEKAYRRAETKGIAVDAAFEERMKKLQGVSDMAHQQMASEKRLDKLQQDVRVTEKVGKGLEAMFMGNALGRIITGQSNPFEVMQLAHSSFKLANRAIQAFATESVAASFAKAIPYVNAIYWAAQGTYAFFTGVKGFQDKKDKLEGLQQKARLGLVSQEEAKFIQGLGMFSDDSAFEQFKSAGSALGSLDSAGDRAQAFGEASRRSNIGATSFFYHPFSTQKQDQARGQEQGEQWSKLFNERYNAELAKTGGSITPEELEHIKTDVTAELEKNMWSGEKSALNEKIAEEVKKQLDEEKAKELAYRPKTGAEIAARQVMELRNEAYKKMHVKFPSDLNNREDTDLPNEHIRNNWSNTGLTMVRLRDDRQAMHEAIQMAKETRNKFARD